MHLSSDYPNLANFLGAWFPDSDFDGLSDEEIVNDFVKTCKKNYVHDVLAELKSLLQLKTIPYEDVAREAYIYFDNEKECLEWLKQINLYIQKSLRE